jgi:hypothetical protein
LHARLALPTSCPWFIFNLGGVRLERVFLCGLYLCSGAGVHVIMAIAKQPDIPNYAKSIASNFDILLWLLKVTSCFCYQFQAFVVFYGHHSSCSHLLQISIFDRAIYAFAQ